ncbi:TOM (translocase of outer membrane) complex component [Mucor velutinosus]|uniref:TOM (Translocase of outer membrane) complex component n=1 Tax=Mucor velutinosus TaxID=708070 RepID=A0AAN7DRM7_9FUNG|nr:TOM (translocase of outer membrane) complex component [Mucor velutinosus]
MHLYVKHATLINNCYPEKEGEKGPRSSELSYLVFYASSRPVKLTKVGLFLEKKAERDIAKGRKQNNQVTLEIIKALIEACHRDLNLFSKYVVKIIDMMLETKEIEVIDLACQVFVIFTNYHDGSTLGVDAELTKDYELLLKKFAAFCSYENADDTLKLQTRYIGQRALQAAVTSAALQASDYKVQLDLILSPLINALSNSKNPANALAQSSNNEDIDIHQSAIGHETLNAHSVEIIAAKTTALLFSKANGVAVKLSLGPLFTFMDTNEKWWPAHFAASMMELVLDSLQPQYRYLLVSEILQQLEAVKSAANADQYKIEKHASLVSILDTILNANIPLVGISVLEVLNSLFTGLIKSVQEFKTFRDAEPASSNNVQAKLEYAIQQGLAHSIGGLASQTYYLNQLNDITGYIISKLRVGSNGLETIDGLPIQEYRNVVLKCLDLVTTASSTKESQKEDTESNNENTPVYNHTVTLDAWIPALGLLTEKTPETRVNFAVTLVHYLEATSENEIAIEPYPKHTLSQHGDVMLVNALHQSIVDWIQLPNIGVHDIDAIHMILSALTRKLGADETIKAVPLVFKIQDLVKQTMIQHTARQRAVAAIVVEWLSMVGEFYRIDSLVQYADVLKSERIRLNEYSPVFLEGSSDITIDKLEDLEPNNTTPVDKFADRKLVVQMLSKDGPLRDEDDTEGTDLEAKLMIEWGSDDYVNHDRNYRIRTSRNLNDLKAKLATPWTNTEVTRNEPGKKQTIRVENLKEALIGQTQQQSDANGLQSLTNACLTKRPNETVADMSSLLQSLSLGTDVSNTTSLVNPPYK